MATNNTEFVVIGGGCFWCMEAVYRRTAGVKSVVNGYAGGHVENPTYERVCTGTTGHAEVVRVSYDPSQIALEEVFDLFFRAHDPTTLDRQGADIGAQYRSIILYADEHQKAAGARAIERVRYSFRKSIVTELVPLARFWPAEDYHQQYFDKHPFVGYCQAVIRPKLEKLALGKDLVT